MKTYFMAWETDNKRGHSIYDFDKKTTPREALKAMIVSVQAEFKGDIKGVISAIQFNRVT